MKKIFLILAILSITVLAFSGCSSQQDVQAEGNTGSGDGYQNNFTLQSLEGEEISLSDYEGKLVVLNFWATWCPPCRAEIPDFIQVYEQYKDKGVQFVGVSNEGRGELQPFVEEYGINYPILIDGTVDTIMGMWGIRAIPTTYILGSDGTVLSKFEGLLTKDKLIDEIEKEL